jgi:tetratricopeptide (TPR) repeat protein
VEAFKGRPEQAIVEGKRAIMLDPNNALAYFSLAQSSGIAQKYGAQLEYVQKGMRLHPNHPENYWLQVGSAYNCLGRFREAADALKEAPPNQPWTHVFLIYTYTELGREQDAEAEAAEVQRPAPSLHKGEKWQRENDLKFARRSPTSTNAAKRQQLRLRRPGAATEPEAAVAPGSRVTF